MKVLNDALGGMTERSLTNEPGFNSWLLSPNGGGMFDAKDIRDGLYAGIKPLLFHWTLIVGEIGDTFGYADRWCYADQDLTMKALRDWSGDGEPTGWHRHPNSGRRRTGGDSAREYIAA